MSRRSDLLVPESEAAQGEMGQLYLASGESVGMRLWDEQPTADLKPVTAREYETVGYVMSGKALLVVGNTSIELVPGDSWLVPANTDHTYRITEHFRALEATSPPGRQGMDQSHRNQGQDYSPEDVLA